jgi:hypothetical protein
VVTKYKIAADCANGAWVARGAFVFAKRNATDEPGESDDDDENCVLTFLILPFVCVLLVNSGDEGCD